MDSELVGKTAMDLLDRLESEGELEDGKIIAVGIVCVVETEDGKSTYTRTNCSDVIAYQQRGLFYDALRVVNDNDFAEVDETDEEDDGDDEI